ncbi:sporulation associated protein [Aspergillus ellipticus CBS 707.79]|uniref:Sporulation associated protein n=1 Tax=Aspergillus ellipticus CBS 707.79 TaxID=1448320 RepID=A0A319D3J7_9EURO|nr:sporulation associated protein [Aspergillus ellipticus CBS 707.79]
MEHSDPCHCPTPKRELVLCFDGTGNTYRVDGEESNILKIFRMLDRRKENRFCYYQPGIGIDITPGAFANLAIRPFRDLAAPTAIEEAFGTSFGQHVINGYRFLARRWQQNSHIYMFGFSRGAYTARFLNEMLDFVGLISADNEEIIPFVWEAFTRYKLARNEQQRKDAKYFLTMCRETMCRPVGRVHFLGLFDTVNSVALLNSKLFNTDLEETQPAPRIMRHAVSLDERRIKFQPVLFSQLQAHGGFCRVSTWVDREEREFQITHGIAPEPPSRTSFEEVYFCGDHSDVGGGWPCEPGSKRWVASQIPLMWMVEEAIDAGLTFDPKQLNELGCNATQTGYDKKIVADATRTPLHDSLMYKSGKTLETMFWRVLECLPFKRPKVAPDGTVQETRWHVAGLRRPMPNKAKLHFSVIDRLRQDPDYRPYNLGVGHLRGQDLGWMIQQWREVVHDKEKGYDKEIEDRPSAKNRHGKEDEKTLCRYRVWHHVQVKGERRLRSWRSGHSER